MEPCTYASYGKWYTKLSMVIGIVLQARQKQALPMVDYNLWAYLAYIYYPPLYIAGPICTFNAFAWQCKQSSAMECRQVCSRIQSSSGAMLVFSADSCWLQKFTLLSECDSACHQKHSLTARVQKPFDRRLLT